MHYDCLKEKAELHAKVLNELSGFLKTPLSSR
jgi:hypothetical protein